MLRSNSRSLNYMDTQTVSFRLSGPALANLKMQQRADESLSKTALRLMHKLLGVPREQDVLVENLETCIYEELQNINARLRQLESQVEVGIKVGIKPKTPKLTLAELTHLRRIATSSKN